MPACRGWVNLEFEDYEVERGGVRFHLSIGNLENAAVAFFYEGKMRVGTIAFAMPSTGEFRASTSSVLLGGKYLLAARAIAERVAAIFGKMSLVSLYTTLDEAEALRACLKLLEDAARTTGP